MERIFSGIFNDIHCCNAWLFCREYREKIANNEREFHYMESIVARFEARHSSATDFKRLNTIDFINTKVGNTVCASYNLHRK